MLHFILGHDWTINHREIMRLIAKDVENRNENRILIVPELITHETERELCAVAGDTASRYAEILSFTRLTRRVSDDIGTPVPDCLDEGGRVVAMAAAARQLSSQLKAYASVETKPDFLTELIDAIDEFKRCCISSMDLQKASRQTSGSLAQKLEELSLLMQSYDALCTQGKLDPRDKMTWLLEQLENSTFAQEHTFYIDGFPDFTRQNIAILEHLIQYSPDVTVSFNCDAFGSERLAFEKAGATAQELYRWAKRAGVEVDVQTITKVDRPLRIMRERLFQGPIMKGAEKDRLRTFHADSRYNAVLHAVQAVRDMVASGCRYRDISLIVADMGQYSSIIDLVFERFHIPVYRAGTEEILSKSVIATVLSALEAALSDFDPKLMLRYLRSALSPLSPDECDLLENYVYMWGIRGQKWSREWEESPEGLNQPIDEAARELLERLNSYRCCAIQPLEILRREFGEARNVCGQTEALLRFLEEIRLEERLDALADSMESIGDHRSAQILNQLWEIMISALEQLYDVLGQTQWEPENYSRILRLLLSQYTVGTIPPVLDAVQVGSVSAMRCHQEKHLIILGAEEGMLPSYSGSSGILTDQDRVTLRELGVPLTGGAMEGIQAEFAEIYGVFCGAEETVSLYYVGEQPSFVFRRMSLLGAGEQLAEPFLDFASAGEKTAGAYLVRWNAIDAASELGISEVFSQMVRCRDYAMGSVGKDGIRKLYGNTLSLSASQIDCQAECRMSYFLKYGLRAKERKEAAVDPAEFGIYVHSVLEQTVRCVMNMGGFHSVSLDETLEIAHRYSDQYALDTFGALESERLSFLFNRNVRELDMVVGELWKELSETKFQPAGLEVEFGSGDGLPAIQIPNGSMSASLRGFVDRVDRWVNADVIYYRVVDYKTGKKDFDYCDIYNGVGLQMLLYMFALREDGKELLGENAVPVGVQYFPARAPYLLTDGVLSDDEAAAKRDTEWKRKGLLLNDDAVLEAMEPCESPKRSFIRDKSGAPVGNIADREQFRNLEKFVFDLLSKIVEDIASGNVEPNPYTRGNSHNACTFCPYGSICHESLIEGRRNYKSMTSQRFWEEIGRRMAQYGG